MFRRRIALPTASVITLPIALAIAAASSAQTPMPIRVTASVDTARLAASGRASLRITLAAEQKIDRALAVRVDLWHAGRRVQRRDHVPPVAAQGLQPGKPVGYELPLLFPAEFGLDGEVEVWLGFLEPDGETVGPPLGAGRLRDGCLRIASFEMPRAAGEPDAAAVDAALAAAAALGRQDAELAWNTLEHAFRRTSDYRSKAKLQQGLLAAGRMPPADLSFEEHAIVARRIRDERHRYLRQVAGRMFDRGKMFGALLLLDEIGGALQEDADRAVLGAVADATRAARDREGIAAKVFALDKEQAAEVEQLVDKYKDGQQRLQAGIEMARNPKRRAVARELVRTLEFTPELRKEAERARHAIETAWLGDVPAEERAEADAARNHPCWARTAHRASHRFVLIGPERLLASIPDDSLLRFDLAYLYLTDLFGHVPNPDGDRLTVYFKELWEFAGGQGGGKIIDIGRADPQQTGQRVDNGLFYHELTHCIDDTRPVYPGFREGLADFGAAFAYQELGQVAAARAAFGAAQRAFLADYLDRDLEYWRIPNYGPSAGFLLHFVQTHGRDGNGYRWDRYRRFFRSYRDCRVQDARTPNIARAFAFHLVEAFGEAAFEDLRRFRWPLLPTDLEAVRREQEAARRPSAAAALDELPGSPVPRDRMAARLAAERAQVADHGLELGVVQDWWVIGPFRRNGVDPDSFRFPPELEVDLGARYDSVNNTPTWRRPGPKPVTVEPSGWLTFQFSYMDDSAIYALTHVRVERPLEAWFHLRTDDDATLFVGDELIGKHDHAGGPFGPWRPDWRTLLPDAIAFRVPLEPGRHKVLLKVRNRGGPSGCTLAIAQRNGTPLLGWRTDAEPPERKMAAIDVPDSRRFPSRFKLDGEKPGSHRRLETTVGGFRTRNRAIEGTATDRQVEWRKYTVRPGFPKDSPSNLAWLPEKATEGLDAFRFTLDFADGSPPPKVGVIFQGDGQRDALGGWTLILEPVGERVRGRLERYDQLIYSSDLLPFPGDSKRATQLELVYYGRRLTVRLGEQMLFDQAPILPIPDRHRIGVVTWGIEPRIAELELRTPARTR